jgi:hypothetical protein
LGQFQYNARVRLALACGLRSDLEPPLNAFGKLRNNFSHRVGTILADKELDKLYSTLGQQDRNAIDFLFERVAMKPGHPKPASMNGLPPKDRFILWAVNLWAAIEVQATLDGGPS